MMAVPVMNCTLDGESGWKWGESGTCYIGPDAKAKAEAQGQAAIASGYASDSDSPEVARKATQKARSDQGPLETMQKVQRYDQGRLLPPRKRQDGSLLVDGVVTAPGVYPYWDSAEGRVVWELKPPDEFATDAFAMKLNALTLTNEHPDPAQHPQGVKLDSFGALGVGMTMPDAQVLEDGRTRVSGVVMRQDGIDAVQGGRTSWSLGAMVDIEHTSGEYNGKRYDRIQRNPQPNHLAFVDVPRVEGAGVRTDSADGIALAVETAQHHGLDGSGAVMVTVLRADAGTMEATVKLIRIDGIDVPEGISGQVQAALDKRDAQTLEQTKRADAMTAERDSLKGELAVASKRNDDAGDDLASAVRKAVDAYDAAKPVADHLDVKLRDDAGTLRAVDTVRRDCLVKHFGLADWSDSKLRSDDAVMGAFEALAHRVAQRDDQLQSDQPASTETGNAYEAARKSYHAALMGGSNR